MTGPDTSPVQDPLPPGVVRREGAWAVGNIDGADFAVSRRCRHQFADLSEGTINGKGCLVCPWHQAQYDVTTGQMVAGPAGFLGYHGRTPRYAAMVLAYSRAWRLRVGKVVRAGTSIHITR